MRRCPDCRGFVPTRDDRCPNCDFVPATRSRRRFWTPLAMLGAGAFSVTACAAYGSPCVATADGGNSCNNNFDPCNQLLTDGGRYRDDPVNAAECKPDAGSPDAG